MKQASQENNLNTLPEITSKVNVLCIGNVDSSSTGEKPDEKTLHEQFSERAKRHFSMLLMAIRTPSDVDVHFDSWEFFSASCIQKDKQPKRYQFHCNRNSDFPEHGIFRGSTYNAQHVMDEVRKALKSENWISDYVIEAPLRTKPTNFGNRHPNAYIQGIVSDALTAGDNMIFKYIHLLHFKHMKRNK